MRIIKKNIIYKDFTREDIEVLRLEIDEVDEDGFMISNIDIEYNGTGEGVMTVTYVKQYDNINI